MATVTKKIRHGYSTVDCMFGQITGMVPGDPAAVIPLAASDIISMEFRENQGATEKKFYTTDGNAKVKTSGSPSNIQFTGLTGVSAVTCDFTIWYVRGGGDQVQVKVEYPATPSSSSSSHS